MGYKKLVAGKPLGRHFFPHISVSSLTRRARDALCPPGAIEFDQATALVSIMVKLAQPYHIHTPNLVKYMKHKCNWRAAVAKYYQIEDDEAKTVLMRAIFGFPGPLQPHTEKGVLPFLHGPMLRSSHKKNVTSDPSRVHPHSKSSQRFLPTLQVLLLNLLHCGTLSARTTGTF